MRIRQLWWAALAALVIPCAAQADDPNDPTMRTAAARARDRERIRQLNLAQLAYVRKRDAGYAEGWNAVREAGGRDAADADYAARRREHAEAVAESARQQEAYDRDMAAWRRAVAACRAGDWSACER